MSAATCRIEVRQGVQRYCHTHQVAFEVGIAKTPPETCRLTRWETLGDNDVPAPAPGVPDSGASGQRGRLDPAEVPALRTALAIISELLADRTVSRELPTLTARRMRELLRASEALAKSPPPPPTSEPSEEDMAAMRERAANRPRHELGMDAAAVRERLGVSGPSEPVTDAEAARAVEVYARPAGLYVDRMKRALEDFVNQRSGPSEPWKARLWTLYDALPFQQQMRFGGDFAEFCEGLDAAAIPRRPTEEGV